MTAITIITKLRLVAVIAPIVLLIATAIEIGGLYTLGQAPALMNEREVAAIRAAQGMDTALYKVQWGRSQPDGQQIVFDQRRSFMSWLDFAQSRITAPEQRSAIVAIGNLAPHLFDALKSAAPEDQSVQPLIDRMHGKIANLASADESAITRLEHRATHVAFILITIAVILIVIVPWACYAVLAAMTGAARRDLLDARKALEEIGARAGSPEPAVAREFEALDRSLAHLGFPKPNPMLAEG